MSERFVDSHVVSRLDEFLAKGDELAAKAGSSVTEVWMTPGGALSFLEWNPCGCHPKDLVLTRRIYKRAHWVNDAVCYMNQSKSAWTRDLRRKGWERLDRWTEGK